MKPDDDRDPEPKPDVEYDVLPPEPTEDSREPSPRQESPIDRTPEAPAPLPPLVRSTRPEWPIALASAAMVLFGASALAGARGLFPVAAAEGVDPDFAARALLLLRGAVLILLGGGCLVAGAYFFSLVESRRLGDLRVLLCRCVAIAAIALLGQLIPVEVRFVKQLLDVAVPLALAWALIMPFFRLSPREAGVLLGGGLVAMVVLAFGSAVVGFALR